MTDRKPNPQERDDQIRSLVRERYAAAAGSSGCCGTASTCCSPQAPAETALALGYSRKDLADVPEGANLGLGCGNPVALAALERGQTVLDLGSGAGFDCFLAASRVGAEGRVIGVDMTPQMVSRARENAASAGAANVEFRLGEIEHLPVADATVDAIISNCVINLSPDKPAVYRDCFRVLRPGGRLFISDVVALRPLPSTWPEDPELLGACIAGAVSAQDVEHMLLEAGFADVAVNVDLSSGDFIKDWQPGLSLQDYVASAAVVARKPA